MVVTSYSFEEFFDLVLQGALLLEAQFWIIPCDCVVYNDESFLTDVATSVQLSEWLSVCFGWMEWEDWSLPWDNFPSCQRSEDVAEVEAGPLWIVGRGMPLETA